MAAEGIVPETALAVNRLYQLDCFRGMRMLPSGSVDFILSDPPYGITGNNWDTKVDLGRLWEEYRRVIRPGGVVALTAQCPFDKELAMSNRSWLRYEWIWEKSRATGFLHARRMPLRAHETVLIFYEQRPTFRPQMLQGKPYRTTRGDSYIRHLGRHVGAVMTVSTGERYPRSVLHIPSEGQPTHPTQKPVALFEYLIRTYTDAGQLVLDTFAGSGTTAIACLQSSRQFIGFEKDRRFFQAADQRIAAHARSLTLR